jgi:hypothetical protein
MSQFAIRMSEPRRSPANARSQWGTGRPWAEQAIVSAVKTIQSYIAWLLQLALKLRKSPRQIEKRSINDRGTPGRPPLPITMIKSVLHIVLDAFG